MAERLGNALGHLQRGDEARVWIARGIAALPQGDPLLAEAWYVAGEPARFGYDYDEAIASYDKAIAIAGAGTEIA